MRNYIERTTDGKTNERKLWKTSGTFDNKLGRTAPRSGQNVFGLVLRNINKFFKKFSLWKP
jgi:hypothetical protein